MRVRVEGSESPTSTCLAEARIGVVAVGSRATCRSLARKTTCRSSGEAPAFLLPLCPPPSGTVLYTATATTPSDVKNRLFSVAPRWRHVVQTGTQALGRPQSQTRLGRRRSGGMGDNWPSALGPQAYCEDWLETGQD